MIGLGRMGANMVRRLMRDGHEVVVFDLNPDSVKELGCEGAITADSMDEFVRELASPRIAWIMVPAGNPVQGAVDELAQRMDQGDIIIDGGNSYYKDDVRRSEALAEKGHMSSRC